VDRNKWRDVVEKERGLKRMRGVLLAEEKCLRDVLR
jgi:hypothetical protein